MNTNTKNVPGIEVVYREILVTRHGTTALGNDSIAPVYSDGKLLDAMYDLADVLLAYDDYEDACEAVVVAVRNFGQTIIREWEGRIYEFRARFSQPARIANHFERVGFPLKLNEVDANADYMTWPDDSTCGEATVQLLTAWNVLDSAMEYDQPRERHNLARVVAKQINIICVG